MASLPAEWQLRFMAYVRLIRERPWLGEKLRAFYRLRRQRFIAQLQAIDKKLHLLEHIFIDADATVYNWSELRPGECAFFNWCNPCSRSSLDHSLREVVPSKEKGLH